MELNNILWEVSSAALGANTLKKWKKITISHLTLQMKLVFMVDMVTITAEIHTIKVKDLFVLLEKPCSLVVYQYVM